VAEQKTWWDYHDEIEALKDQRAEAWRLALPDDPHTVTIPKQHRQRMLDEAERTFNTHLLIATTVQKRREEMADDERAKMKVTRREHYGIPVTHESEMTPEMHRYLAQMHYATFLAREADNHPSVTEIDAKMRALREEQLALCEEPDYEREPARPGLRERDDWRQ
jgi:hypothetical protein